MGSPPHLLSVSGLTKSVPGGRVLFNDVALEVGAGEIVAIMGESGVGKSTFLNLIAGLDRAERGGIFIEGVDLGSLNEGELTRLRRDRIGFVFQAFHVLPYLTLAENVGLPLALRSSDRRDIGARATEMLAKVGLADRGRDYSRDLSGGELQRVAIARALVHAPALILADEPTGNLDPETAGHVLALFAETVRERGAAALIVTHSPVAAAIADRTLLLTRSGLAAA